MVGFVVVAVLIAVAGTAQAKVSQRTNFEVQPANTSGFVDLGKVGRYRAGLFMPNDRVAMLYLSRRKMKGKWEVLSSSVSVYAVHSRRSLARGVIRARFGSLGSVSLRFHPNGRVREGGSQQRECEGPPSFTEFGRFVGRATFRGEDDYFHFSLPGGSGGISRSFRLRCERGEAVDLTRGSLRAYMAYADPGSFFAMQGDIALLYASAREHGRYIGIMAGHEAESLPGAEVRIRILESRGGMAIGRYALVPGHAGTLLTSSPGVHPATATLAPPAPFSGEGAYLEEGPAGLPNWAGTLSVNFPGLTLPLTGPRFHVRLCVLRALKVRKGCNFFKAEPQFDERLARPGPMVR